MQVSFGSVGFNVNSKCDPFSELIDHIENGKGTSFERSYSLLLDNEKAAFLSLTHEDVPILLFALKHSYLIALQLANEGATLPKGTLIPYDICDVILSNWDYKVLVTIVIDYLKDLGDEDFFAYWNRNPDLLHQLSCSSIALLFNACDEKKRAFLMSLQNSEKDGLIYSVIKKNDKDTTSLILGQLQEEELKLLFAEEPIISIAIGAIREKYQYSLQSILETAHRVGSLDTLLLQRDREGSTVLHWMCYMGYHEEVEWVLDHLDSSKQQFYLSINNLEGFLPLNLAVNQEKIGVVRVLAVRCQDCLLSANKNGGNILERIFILKSTQILETLSKCLKREETIMLFKTLFTQKTPKAKMSISYSIRPSSFGNEKERIEILKWFRNFFADDAYFSSLLTHVDNEQRNLLHYSVSNANLMISKYLIENFSFLVNLTDANGTNILHALAQADLSDMQSTDFFMQHLSKLPLEINSDDKNGMTPLLHASYSNKPKLAEAYIKCGANKKSFNNGELAKAISHSWSLDYLSEGENHPLYRFKMSGWNPLLAAKLMHNSLSYFIQNLRATEIDPRDDICLETLQKAFSVFAQEDYKTAILELNENEELWVAPISSKKHVVYLVGYENFIIICDRTSFTISNTTIPSGFIILTRDSNLTREEHLEIINTKPEQLVSMRIWQVLRSQGWQHFNYFIYREEQPLSTCCWINAKGAIYAGVFIQMIVSSKDLEKEDYRQLEAFTRFFYKGWSDFHRLYILNKYRSIHSDEDPIIAAVESKLCLKSIVKVISQEAIPDHIQKTYKKLISENQNARKLKHDINTTKERVKIITALYNLDYPWLKIFIKKLFLSCNIKTIALKEDTLTALKHEKSKTALDDFFQVISSLNSFHSTIVSYKVKN